MTSASAIVAPLLIEDFLPAPQRLEAWIQRNGSFRTEQLRLFGRQIPAPRSTDWYGDPNLNYRYSGADHLAGGWPAPLADVRDAICAELSLQCNFVLINRYANGGEYMGWHKDDERGLIDPIISISLGGTRRFLLESSQERFTYQLKAGSLLMHSGQWRHCLPKTKKPVAPRINLSFRCLDNR